MIKWTIYEVNTKTTPIHGVKFRGRVRKFAVENNIDMLIDNASDKHNCVRFAVLENTDIMQLKTYVLTIAHDAKIDSVLEHAVNPVLSKLRVNDLSRYNVAK